MRKRCLIVGIVTKNARTIASSRGTSSRPNLRRKMFDVDYLTADKNHALMDQPLNVRVQNLPKGQEVTLRTSYDNSDERKSGLFQSFAFYEARQDGCIETSSSPSLGGTYEGIEPMGPFSSMAPALNPPYTKTRILTRDPSAPLPFKVEIYEGFIDFNSPNAMDDVGRYLVCQELDSMYLYRCYQAPNVSEEIMKHGKLYIPQSDGKSKGILHLNGIGAGDQPARAALLASHGSAVYHCRYDSKNVHIEDFEEAVEELLNHPKVDQSGIGILASCLGGMIALTLASDSRVMKKIKSLVCVNTVDCPAVYPIYRNRQPCNFFPFIKKNMRWTEEGHGMTRYCFDRNKEEQEASRVPVENMKCKLLLLAGQDDKSVPADVMAQKINDTMIKHGKRDQCEMVLYPGTGHLIEPPFLPLCSNSYVDEFGAVCAWGGEPKPHADAQEDAWKRIKEFYDKTL